MKRTPEDIKDLIEEMLNWGRDPDHWKKVGVEKAIREYTQEIEKYYQGLDKKVREYLWLNHGCPINTLYGDDGEMQCAGTGKHILDFKRDKLIDLLKEISKSNTLSDKEFEELPSCEIFKAIPNYEIEQTVLTQRSKMCAELGEYVRKRDYDKLKTLCLKALKNRVSKNTLSVKKIEKIIKEKGRKVTKEGILVKLVTKDRGVYCIYKKDLAQAIHKAQR